MHIVVIGYLQCETNAVPATIPAAFATLFHCNFCGYAKEFNCCVEYLRNLLDCDFVDARRRARGRNVSVITIMALYLVKGE